MVSVKRKQSRWKPGTVYAVPLTDGSFGIAQAGETQGEFVNVIYVALFADRYMHLPNEVPPLKRDSAVSLWATWRQALNRGEWLSLGVAPEIFKKSEFPNERYAREGYVGASHSDAGLLAKFLSAFHGLLPWNVMHDPAYYDRFLRPGLPRPSSVRILDESEREKYRREVLKIGA
jgi:hypothetical protein